MPTKAPVVVADEGQEYRGTRAIKSWLDSVTARYKPNIEAIDFAAVGDAIVATAQVSGTFPRSSIQLSYNFNLRMTRLHWSSAIDHQAECKLQSRKAKVENRYSALITNCHR